MDSGCARFGDWNGLVRRLTTTGGRMRLAVADMPRREGVRLASKIRDGITSQAPGGKRFHKLADATIRRKGSSKALIDTADMRNSVTSQEIERGRVFVGLLRTRIHRKEMGEKSTMDVANLGYIHEVEGVRAGKGGKHRIRRPFIMPVWEKEKEGIKRRFVGAVEGVLTAKG